MKKNFQIFIVAMLCLLLGQTLMAQNTFPGTGNVGVGTTTPAASAILEVRSNTQGILIPRMSQIKREAIVDPALGLIVFQTTTPKGIYMYLGSGWQQMGQQGDMGLTGPAGPTGATGPMGPEGPAGADGLNGAVGATGATGPMGPMGPEGPAGADGVDGTNGIDGVNGLDGATGATGPMGPEGPAGPAGADGADGVDGTNGIDGVNGLDGATGATGATGPMGPMGPEGPAGANGADGVDGLDGATGATGPMGPMGPAGPIGLTGATGPIGATGLTGPEGPAGANGLNGADGATGATGPAGPIGLTGATGPIGATGLTGAEGPAGANGLNGADGATGATGPAGPIGLTGLTGPIGPTGLTGATGPAGANGLNGTNGVDGATGPMGPEGPAGPAGADGADGFLTAGSASGNTPFWDGTDWITNSSNLYNAGSNIGIGTTTPNHQLELSTDDAAKPGTNTWTVVSDQRLKENINAYEGGLSEVLKINPVTFHYNVKSGFDTNPEYVGVLAQELQKVAPSMVNNFTKEGEQYLAINNGEMTYMLINAVKDLNTQVSENNIEIENLNSKIELLEEQLEKVNTAIFGEGSNDGAAIINVGATSNSMLGQNVPNPFDNSTLIPFRIPKNCSDASIMITDAVYGKVISVIPISCDETHVSVDAGTLASGVYSYTLIVNGVVIETKEMVLSK